MLVLTRRIGERIKLTIGSTVVWVSVERINGPEVRIGFDAPMHVGIAREEVDPRPRQPRD